MTDLAPQWIARFGLQAVQHLTDTDIARLWRATAADGADVVLKLYVDGNEHDEGPGIDLLSACRGAGAVRILDRAPGAVLMEYLDGPTLGDLVRDGQDDTTMPVLADTALRLQSAKVGPHALTPLADRIAPIFRATTAPDCPAILAQALPGCQSLARDLLATAPDPVALHGDLHHDNVLHGARGWCAIDAKGVWGDPAYEMANAFRNPVGTDALWRAPDRASRMAACFASVLNLPPERLLGWAAVHAVMSILWSQDGPLGPHPDADLPGLFLKLYHNA